MIEDNIKSKLKPTPRPNSATATAASNVALVKYWGKLDHPRRIPATGSLSVTMGDLKTKTTVSFSDQLGRDSLVLNGAEALEAERNRVSLFLDLIRELARSCGHRIGAASIISENTFPTAAGLASSASGFAALTGASLRAAGIKADEDALASIARLGSASAARSIHGGFVEMAPYISDSGDWRVQTRRVAPRDHWDLRVLVAIVDAGKKVLGSTPAMDRSAETSPYYPVWTDSWVEDLKEANEALIARDMDRLALVTEHSTLKMHALTMTSRPPVQYLRGPSIELMHRVWDLRSNGTPCTFTADAGPNIKVLCHGAHETTVRDAISSVNGVISLHSTVVGGGIEVVDDD